MQIQKHLFKLTDDLGRAAMERVKRIMKSDGHHIHVVVLAVEFLPPNGSVGDVQVSATFTDNEGLRVMASLLNDLHKAKVLK